MTDEEVDQQVTAAQNSLWGIAGASAGTFLGTAFCGILPGAAVVRINPAKLAAIAEVDKELYEEIMPQVRAMIMGTVRVAQVIGFTQIYKNVRKWIKSKSSTIRSFSPSLANTIDKWGEKSSKPWTINKAVEEKIETIPDAGIRNYYENLYEEFVDSCTEALFVMSTAFG
jgi:membrane-associated protease RseP (regulator of RpoE activity)